jgi:hypothetical protein
VIICRITIQALIWIKWENNSSTIILRLTCCRYTFKKLMYANVYSFLRCTLQ